MFEPLEIPDPFHPAFAYYPIVLTLLGTLLAFGALLTRRAGFPFWTFLILLLATAAAQFALVTGGQEHLGQLPPMIAPLIQQHIEWSQRARNFGLITTCVALLSLMVARVPRVRRLVALATFALGLFTSYSGLRAAEQGRKLVFNYAVGVSTPAPATRSSPPLPWASVTPTASPAATRR
ncbi:MAG: hypothetical protein JO015_11640 [Verrucomicrobia bacterium]|nr:hypothetical protein [Verrucomicrobiota bacterium]